MVAKSFFSIGNLCWCANSESLYVFEWQAYPSTKLENYIPVLLPYSDTLTPTLKSTPWVWLKYNCALPETIVHVEHGIFEIPTFFSNQLQLVMCFIFDTLVKLTCHLTCQFLVKQF